MGASTLAAPVRLAVIGAGNRGSRAYGAYGLRHPDRARIVAVADPDEGRRAGMAAEHGIGSRDAFHDWQALLEADVGVDAVIVATPDREHVEPTIAAVRAGLPVLLEKPVAHSPEALEQLLTGVGAAANLVTVAHVLRYTPFFRRLKTLLDDGAIGQLVTIEHAEHIGYWHFAHSYVRGNWRREDLASPMILAKACHDLDLLQWLAGARWQSLGSFGSLAHFRGENRPTGAPDHCVEGCPVAASCPFETTRIYAGDDPIAGPNARGVATSGFPTLDHALRHGPYGRCVYACDNDVADHQVATIEFANGVTASLTVAAFTPQLTRTVRLLGTLGMLEGDLRSGKIELSSFLSRYAAARRIDELGDDRSVPDSAFLGHAGGDDGVMEAFLAGVEAHRRGDDRGTGPATNLEDAIDSHHMAFAAERSRHSGVTVHASDREVAPPSSGWSVGVAGRAMPGKRAE